MIYRLDEEVVKSFGLTMSELLTALLIKTGANIPKVLEEMEEKKMITKDSFNNYLVYSSFDNKVATIILDSDKDRISDDVIDDLVTKLMKIFPKQKKLGTCHYFRGNRRDITLRLKKFFKLYGNKYTPAKILQAAEKYVASFNGDYKFMRILKYFIWKDEKKMDEEGKVYIEATSDLATWIDNLDSEDEHSQDWTSTLK